MVIWDVPSRVPACVPGSACVRMRERGRGEMLGLLCLDGSEERENEPKDSDSAVPTETMKPVKTQLLGWLGFFVFLGFVFF